MRIATTNAFNYSQNNVNQLQKSPSFGKFVPSEKYKNDLIEHNQEQDLLDLLNNQEPISVKKLLDYDNLNPIEQRRVDRFLKLMPPEEVEDLTVEITTYDKHNIIEGAKCGHMHDVSMEYKFPRNDIRWIPSMSGWAKTTYNHCSYREDASDEEKNEIIKQYSDDMVNNSGFKLRSMDQVPVLADREKALSLIAKQMKKAFISVN